MPRPPANPDVFQAIAEPRRRQIVELLARRGALAVGAIVLALGVPQPAVSKHLGVLREVGLVSVTQQGKQRIYALNPEELKAVHAWISSFERLWSAQAERIRQRAERMAAERSGGRGSRFARPHGPRNPFRRARIMLMNEADRDVQTLSITQSIEIAAPPLIAFEAVLAEIGPGSEMPDGTPFPMVIEPWPGGRWYRDTGEREGFKSGHLWGHVQVIKPPMLLELTGPMFMSYPTISHVQYRLTETAGGVTLTIRHQAIGLIDPEHREGVTEGWAHGLSRIKQIAEQRVNK